MISPNITFTDLFTVRLFNIPFDTCVVLKIKHERSEVATQTSKFADAYKKIKRTELRLLRFSNRLLLLLLLYFFFLIFRSSRGSSRIVAAELLKSTVISLKKIKQ